MALRLATSLLAELAWVRRLARRLVADDADDLTQDVATLTLEHPPRAGGLRAWLGAVTRRRAARWHRDRHRRQQIEDASTPPSNSDDRNHLGPGHVRFRRLAANGVTVHATIAGRTIERTVDPSTQAELVIRVPAR